MRRQISPDSQKGPTWESPCRWEPPAHGEGGTSHHVDGGGAAGRRPLAAVGEAAVIGRGAIHVRRLQLHLAGGDGCVQLHLSPVDHVEHQADADDDLWGKTATVVVIYTNTIFMWFFQ